MEFFNQKKKIKQLEAEVERLRSELHNRGQAVAWFRSEYGTYKRMYEDAYNKLSDKNRDAVLRIAGELTTLFFRDKEISMDWFVKDKEQGNPVPEVFVDIARRIVVHTDETTPECYKATPENHDIEKYL